MKNEYRIFLNYYNICNLFRITGIIFAEDFNEGIKLNEGKNTVNFSFEFSPIYVGDLIKAYPEITTITYTESEEEIGYVNVFGGIGENFVIYPNKTYEITTNKGGSFKFKMKKILSLNLIVIFLVLPFCSAAHYIVGYVENAKDGTNADGHSIVLWNPEIGIADNVSDIIGPTGNSRTNNIYMIDCEMLRNGCNISKCTYLKSNK